MLTGCIDCTLTVIDCTLTEHRLHYALTVHYCVQWSSAALVAGMDLQTNCADSAGQKCDARRLCTQVDEGLCAYPFDQKLYASCYILLDFLISATLLISRHLKPPLLLPRSVLQFFDHSLHAKLDLSWHFALSGLCQLILVSAKENHVVD